jgi:hypothetical protein
MSDDAKGGLMELAAGVLRLRDEVQERTEYIEAIGLELLKSGVQPTPGEDWVTYAGRVASAARSTAAMN